MSKIPAVGYFRRSTADQEDSIDQQKVAVRKYADDNGYNLIREYDETISGDDTKNRVEFLTMRDDVTEAADFKAVVCWDQDRFGRFDSLEAGHWIYPFREASVMLVTVGDGPMPWDDFASRIVYSVKQEGKHQYLQDLSRNIVRGMNDALLNHSWRGRAPLGYQIVGKPKNKKLILGDESQILLVNRISTSTSTKPEVSAEPRPS